MPSYHSEILNQDNENDWEAFNRLSHDGSYYHTIRWLKVLEKSFHLKNQCFLVYKDKDPVALCPLFEQKVKGVRILAPLPSSDLKHFVIEDSTDHELMKSIIDMSIRVAKERRCAFVILVNSNTISIETIRSVCSMDKRKTIPFNLNGYLTLDLHKNAPAYIWDNIFNSKDGQKKYIRRFERAGFEFRESKSRSDLGVFYEYYSQNLKQIGAAPFERSHFDVLFDECEKDIRMTLLEANGVLAGGILAVLDSDMMVMHLRYMAINREMSNTFHPPYALYWEAINRAFNDGYREVCFGTNNKDANDKSYRIKKGFGCEYKDNYAEMIPTNFIYGILYNITKNSGVN
jgi:hypothetical protein